MKYQVKWKNYWKSLTKYMSLRIIFLFAGYTLVRFVSLGFDYGETFEHLSLMGAIGVTVGGCVFFAVVMLPIAFSFKFYPITIDGGCIQGRNYWGRKKSFPLNKLKSLDSFSDSGVNAVVADGGSYGKVFIHLHTEKFDELKEILESYLPGGRGA